ncbi:MAG: hypothetical protein K2V38_11805, partial [Gemmataceae bacterium]|nr:hypothetical protein [Gemmataceae bacterium]
VARGLTNGLFVSGTGGCGKSRVIAGTLAEEGINPVLLNSHVTPLSLYIALYEHRQGKVLWLDDADAAYTSMPILGLLRSALWGTAEGRVVTYSSSQLAGVPGSFEFESRIVFCANTIPKRNEAFRAVLSRVDVFELVATNDELLEQMDVLARDGFGSLDAAACQAIVNYIRHAGGNRQLSMRLYESSLRKVQYAVQAGTDWRDLVRSQLDQLGSKDRDGIPKPLDTRGHDLRCMALAMEKFPQSAKQQEEFWCESTAKSRATFFRIKKLFESRHQENDQ